MVEVDVEVAGAAGMRMTSRRMPSGRVCIEDSTTGDCIDDAEEDGEAETVTLAWRREGDLRLG